MRITHLHGLWTLLFGISGQVGKISYAYLDIKMDPQLSAREPLGRIAEKAWSREFRE